MKNRSIRSILLTLLLALGTSATFAATKTYYVCSGVDFTLASGDGTGTLTYQWTGIEGTTLTPVTTYDLDVTAPTIAVGDAFQTLTYQLTVSEGGCQSNPDTFRVYVLPPMEVNITGLDSVYCAGSPISSDLTAEVVNPVAADLPAGVAADEFLWSGGSTATTATITATATGTYNVAVTYSLPTNDGEKLDGCTGTDSVTISETALPTIPAVTFE